MLDLLLGEQGLQAVGLEGGEGVLGEDGRLVAGEGEQFGAREAELGRHLLGEGDGQAEAAGGGDRERGAAHEGVGAGDGGEEGLLQVDDEQEGAGERGVVHELFQ